MLSSSSSQERDDLWCFSFNDVANAVALPSTLISSTIIKYHQAQHLSEGVSVDGLQGPVWQIAEVRRLWNVVSRFIPPIQVPIARDDTRLVPVSQHNALAKQQEPRREFVVLSASGTYRFTAFRYVDVLRKLLEKRNDALLAEFFHVPSQVAVLTSALTFD